MSEEKPLRLKKSERILIIAVLLSAFTGIVIGLLRKKGLDGSALLYIGIPTFIGLIFATVPPATSVMGSTLKAITFMILISGPLLQEGYICMVMAAPILYIVGALVAWPFDYNRKKKKSGEDSSQLNVLVLPAIFLIMSMEGVTDSTSFNRHNEIKHTQVIEGSVDEVKAKLGKNRILPSPDSLFAKLFPRPRIINADGLAVGSKHWIDVNYFKWIYWNEKKGTTQFKVVEHQPEYIKFKSSSDNSYFKNYLDWGDVTVYFQPVTKSQTKVTWHINFTRKIDPAWYVQPLQRYAVGVAAETLMASIQ